MSYVVVKVTSLVEELERLSSLAITQPNTDIAAIKTPRHVRTIELERRAYTVCRIYQQSCPDALILKFFLPLLIIHFHKSSILISTYLSIS